jgi:hypothetical protein
MKSNRKGKTLMLSCGDSHSLAISTRGQVYQWGETDLFQLGLYSHQKQEPRPIPRGADELLVDLSYIQSGYNHTVAYSRRTNRLVLWGDNTYGQLGVGSFRPVPNLVELTHLIKHDTWVVSIETRANSTAFVLSDGTCYVWPCACEGGVVEPIPKYAAFDKEKVMTVSLGADFSVFLLANGTVYTMGASSKHGELGHGDDLPKYVPTRIKSLFKAQLAVAQVSCGFRHTLIRTISGKVLAWGWGERGQIGQGNDWSSSVPIPVKLPSPAINVQCGFRSSYALLENRKLVVWGSDGRRKRQLSPIEYSNPEDEIYFMKGEFKPLKIVTTWSRTISVSTLIMADLRFLTNTSAPHVEVILKQVYKDWEQNYYQFRPQLSSKISAIVSQPKYNLHQNALQGPLTPRLGPFNKTQDNRDEEEGSTFADYEMSQPLTGSKSVPKPRHSNSDLYQASLARYDRSPVPQTPKKKSTYQRAIEESSFVDYPAQPSQPKLLYQNENSRMADNRVTPRHHRSSLLEDKSDLSPKQQIKPFPAAPDRARKSPIKMKSKSPPRRPPTAFQSDEENDQDENNFGLSTPLSLKPPPDSPQKVFESDREKLEKEKDRLGQMKARVRSLLRKGVSNLSSEEVQFLRNIKESLPK